MSNAKSPATNASTPPPSFEGAGSKSLIWYKSAKLFTLATLRATVFTCAIFRLFPLPDDVDPSYLVVNISIFVWLDIVVVICLHLGVRVESYTLITSSALL